MNIKLLHVYWITSAYDNSGEMTAEFEVDMKLEKYTVSISELEAIVLGKEMYKIAFTKLVDKIRDGTARGERLYKCMMDSSQLSKVFKQ